MTSPGAPASDLDRLLPPQIRAERFYRAIRRVAASRGVRTVLEIGASSGGGSTEALVAGALANPDGPPHIHSIEVSEARFGALVERWRKYPFVHPHHVSSVPSSAFPGEAEVTRFYREVRSKLRNNRLPKVLGWLRQDLAYLAEHPALDAPGIRRIRAEHGIDTFDAVLVDGSEFTGEAELGEVYGARFLLLDDTRSYKNWANQRRLLADPAYRRVAWSFFARNGWAVFERLPWRDVHESETAATRAAGAKQGQRHGVARGPLRIRSWEPAAPAKRAARRRRSRRGPRRAWLG